MGSVYKRKATQAERIAQVERRRRQRLATVAASDAALLHSGNNLRIYDMQLGFTREFDRVAENYHRAFADEFPVKWGRGDHRGFVYAEEGASDTLERRLVKNAYLERGKALAKRRYSDEVC